MFRRFNLKQSFDSLSSFRFVFCRNVMIYFDAVPGKNWSSRFHSVLEPGRISHRRHPESLHGVRHSFGMLTPRVSKDIIMGIERDNSLQRASRKCGFRGPRENDNHLFVGSCCCGDSRSPSRRWAAFSMHASERSTTVRSTFNPVNTSTRGCRCCFWKHTPLARRRTGSRFQWLEGLR